MWPFKKTTGLERAAKRYVLVCVGLGADLHNLHPYHIALNAIALELHGVCAYNLGKNDAFRMDPVAYLAFLQAMWYDCSTLLWPASEPLRAIAYTSLLEAGHVLYQEIAGKPMSSLESSKYIRAFQQALDAFPAVRASSDGGPLLVAFISLAVACGYPADPHIATALMGRYIGFREFTAPALASVGLSDKDPILDRTGLIAFDHWLELVGARDRQCDYEEEAF